MLGNGQFSYAIWIFCFNWEVLGPNLNGGFYRHRSSHPLWDAHTGLPVSASLLFMQHQDSHQAQPLQAYAWKPDTRVLLVLSF